MIPGDIQAGRHYENAGSLRIGTREATRLGIKKGEMTEVTGFIKRVVVGKEDTKKAKQDVVAFRKIFRTHTTSKSPRNCTPNCDDEWTAIR